MKFRKLTSLMMVIGLVASLFHPLAHAGSLDSHLDSHGDLKSYSQASPEFVMVSMVQALDQTSHEQGPVSGHDEDGFVTNHCETCHVFAHIFTILATQSGRSIAKLPVHAGLVSSPATADVSRFDRPPWPVA